MHGPGLNYYAPEFEQPITVYDGVALSLHRRRQKKWRAARARGLLLWSNPIPGLWFDVREVEPLFFTGIGGPDWPTASSEVVQYSVPGVITLVRSTYTPPAPKFWAMSWAYGYASFYNVRRILKQTDPFYALDRTICHEIGHNLGLAHGGSGIMAGGLVPNRHDLDSVRSYYFGT